MTPPAAHTTETVRAHYASLAEHYDAGANVACKRAYTELVRETLCGATRVIELGAGSSSLTEATSAHFRVACDLSWEMLSRQGGPGAPLRVVADAQALPFASGSFDAAYSINVLEHVPDPMQVARETARVLAPNGLMLALTPNGDAEWLLDLLEQWHLKLPEGPHRFLSSAACQDLGGDAFALVAFRKCLAFPAGPAWFVKLVDRLLAGRGLFMYVLLRRTDHL